MLAVSLIVFLLGVRGEGQANRYVWFFGILEQKPSTIRRKAGIKLIWAYLLALAAFLVYYFWYS